MTKILFCALIAGGLGLACAGPASAWSTGSTPSGNGLSRQFSDPDEAVDNIANGAQGGGGTELSVGGMNAGSGAGSPQGSAGGTAITVKDTDAEPVNPGWPLWMQWHQN